jgi:hypothetical protein
MRLPHVVKDDIGLKVLALLLALFLWFTVAERRQVELDVELPLKYINMPPEMTFASEVPRTAKAKIRGKGKFLRWRLQDVYFGIDLSPAEGGIITHIISPGEIETPSGKDVEVLEVIEPKGIRVELDKLVTKKVSPMPVLEGELPDDKVMLGKPKTDPAEIVISGAEKLIEPLDSVATTPVDLGQLGRKGRVEARIDLTGLLHAESDVEKVDVTARIESVKELKIPSVPLESPAQRGVDVEFTPDSLDITVAGAESRVDSLDPEALRLVANVAGLPEGQLVFTPVVREGALYFEARPVGGAEEEQVFEIKVTLEAPHEFMLISALPREVRFVKK